jgi:hypothetical protein
MNQQDLERALKKQRLILRSAELRAALAEDGEPLLPLFAAGDYVAEGVAWLKARPRWLVAGLVAFVVARPSRLLRWGRRGFFLWRAVRRLRQFAVGSR